MIGDLIPGPTQFFPLTDLRFWHSVRSDFPLILLNPTQPIDHIRRMASILCTSVTSQSFGPRGSNEAAQRQNESNLLASITRVLADTPGSTTGEPRWDKVEAVELRKEIVQFLGTVAGTKLGIEALAQHPAALLRLSKRIAEELEEVYEWKYGADRRYVFFFSFRFSISPSPLFPCFFSPFPFLLPLLLVFNTLVGQETDSRKKKKRKPEIKGKEVREKEEKDRVVRIEREEEKSK